MNNTVSIIYLKIVLKKEQAKWIIEHAYEGGDGRIFNYNNNPIIFFFS